jgi:hypothetical protein
MANTWGSTSLKILVGSAKLEGVSSSLTESQLLPDQTDFSAISTVIQQQCRKRRKVAARLYVATMADYYSFLDDMDTGTTATLTIEITDTSGTYEIETIGEPEYKRHDIIFFDITWMEV